MFGGGWFWCSFFIIHLLRGHGGSDSYFSLCATIWTYTCYGLHRHLLIDGLFICTFLTLNVSMCLFHDFPCTSVFNLFLGRMLPCMLHGSLPPYAVFSSSVIGLLLCCLWPNGQRKQSASFLRTRAFF